MKKKIIWIIVAVGIIGLGAWFFLRDKSSAPPESYTVDTGTVTSSVSVNAKLTPMTYANIGAEAVAKVANVNVAVGDHVKKGQVLLTLDRADLWQRIAAAKIAVTRAEIAERAMRLKSAHATKAQKLDRKKATEQARIHLRELYALAAKGVLTAPLDGVVSVQNAHVGELATGTRTGPIIRIIDPKSLEIEAYISESDIVDLHVGQEAQMTFDALNGTPRKAHITHIDPEATSIQDVVYFRVRFALDETDERLRPGMSGDIDIITKQSDDAVRIPLRFIRRDDAGTYVFIKKEGSSADNTDYIKKYITIGTEGDDGFVAVSDGLASGTTIYLLTEES